MLTCRQTVGRLLDEPEAQFTAFEWVGLRVHLLVCGKCRDFAKRLRELRSYLSRGVPGGEDEREATLEFVDATFARLGLDRAPGDRQQPDPVN